MQSALCSYLYVEFRSVFNFLSVLLCVWRSRWIYLYVFILRVSQLYCSAAQQLGWSYKWFRKEDRITKWVKKSKMKTSSINVCVQCGWHCKHVMQYKVCAPGQRNATQTLLNCNDFIQLLQSIRGINLFTVLFLVFFSLCVFFLFLPVVTSTTVTSNSAHTQKCIHMVQVCGLNENTETRRTH